jgi:hypothetical protein
MLRSHPTFCLLAPSILILLLVACDAQSPTPTDPMSEVGGSGSPNELTAAGASREAPVQAGQFFPLSVGNRWGYQRTFQLWTVDDDGVPVGPGLLIRSTVDRELVGTEVRFGREYVLERQETTEDGRGEPLIRWIHYRQDRSGLYGVFDVLVESPASGGSARDPVAVEVSTKTEKASEGITRYLSTLAVDENLHQALQSTWSNHSRKLEALDQVLGMVDRIPVRSYGPPGGVLAKELTRLRYPLHPGVEWSIYPDTDFWRLRVERMELVELPAGRIRGWRIRILISAFGPNDIAYLWYGPCGFLKYYARVESEARGPGGEPLGKLLSEELEILDDISLKEPNRCGSVAR